MSFLKSFFDEKFFKFIIVGLINTAVGQGLQFGILNLTVLVTMGQQGMWIASGISYILGSILSYVLNKHFTFKNKEKGIKPVLRFALNIAIGYILAYSIAIPSVTYLCNVNQWTMFGLSVEQFSANLGLVVGSCLFVAFNYVGQRYFAFKEKKEDDV